MVSGALAELLDTRPITASRWGLERIEALLEAVGQPQHAFDSIHVAGTNGKGSTSAFIERILRETDRKTALYTSPHLVDVRERFRVDGRLAESDLLDRAARRVLETPAAGPCTYFEAATAVAFLAFAEAGVATAVIETGLGGRLDATNVVRPIAASITPIGLDHTNLLGETVAKIAAEKGGIVKPSTPAASAAQSAAALRVLRARADEVGADLRVLGAHAAAESIEVDIRGTAFRYRSAQRREGIELRTRMVGAHQARNAALAILTLEGTELDPDDASIRAGVEQTLVPGRFHVHEEGDRTWVLDIAHNPAAMEIVRLTVAAVSPPRPIVAVVGVLADKDWARMLDTLALDSEAIILTQPASAPEARRWDLAEAERRLAEQDVKTYVRPDVTDAVEFARELAGEGTVLATGSAHTVGDVAGRLGVAAWDG